MVEHTDEFFVTRCILKVGDDSPPFNHSKEKMTGWMIGTGAYNKLEYRSLPCNRNDKIDKQA
ncbi:MAG: hypothetical protein HY800_08470 [Ignavibacteriales bacterium]|nr:hypothetical protein [Ignavibacteriales bacterium]